MIKNETQNTSSCTRSVSKLLRKGMHISGILHSGVWTLRNKGCRLSFSWKTIWFLHHPYTLCLRACVVMFTCNRASEMLHCRHAFDLLGIALRSLKMVQESFPAPFHDLSFDYSGYSHLSIRFRSWSKVERSYCGTKQRLGPVNRRKPVYSCETSLYGPEPLKLASQAGSDRMCWTPSTTLYLVSSLYIIFVDFIDV